MPYHNVLGFIHRQDAKYARNGLILRHQHASEELLALQHGLFIVCEVGLDAVS